jgi:hypothetical protein
MQEERRYLRAPFGGSTSAQVRRVVEEEKQRALRAIKRVTHGMTGSGSTINRAANQVK